MKILSVSDLHFNLKHYEWLGSSLDEYQLLIIIGDLVDLISSESKSKQIVTIQGYLNEYAQKLPVLVCSGNHDLDSTLQNGELSTQWIRELNHDSIHVDGDFFVKDKLLFSICPWWDGADVRKQMVNMLKEHQKIDAKEWIWLHHAPPQGSRTSYTRKGNAGDPYLKKLIGRYQPSFVFCGHIHNAPYSPEGSWYEKIGSTWTFNAGKQLGNIPSHIKVDLEEQTAEYFSTELKEMIEL